MSKVRLHPLALSAILLAATPGQAQDDPTALLPEVGYAFQAFYSQGMLAGVHGAIHNVAVGNPAAAQDFQHFSLGLAYQYETASDPFSQTASIFEREPANYIQSAGIILPIGRLRIGGGFSERYSALTSSRQEDDQDVPVASFIKLGGAQAVEGFAKTRIYDLSGLGSLTLTNILTGPDRLDLGLAVRKSFFGQRRRSALLISSREDGEGYSFTLGFRYRPGEFFLKRVHLGGFFEQGPKIKSLTTTSTFITRGADGSLVGSNARTKRVVAELPSRYVLGVRLGPWHNLVIMTDWGRVDWQFIDANTGAEMLLAVGLVYGWRPWLSASLGYYGAERGLSAVGQALGVNADFYRASFVTAGARLRLGFVELDLAAARSTASESFWGEQTIMKVGLALLD